MNDPSRRCQLQPAYATAALSCWRKLCRTQATPSCEGSLALPCKEPLPAPLFCLAPLLPLVQWSPGLSIRSPVPTGPAASSASKTINYSKSMPCWMDLDGSVLPRPSIPGMRCQSRRCATVFAISLGPAEHARSTERVADRDSPQRLVWRAWTECFGTKRALCAPPLGDAVTAQVVALTSTEPPGQTTHWTAAALAAARAASARSSCPMIC